MARRVAGGQRTVAVAVGDLGRVMGKAFQQALAQRGGAGACFQQGQPLAFGQGGQGCFHQAAQLAGQHLPAAFANQDTVDACRCSWVTPRLSRVSVPRAKASLCSPSRPTK